MTQPLYCLLHGLPVPEDRAQRILLRGVTAAHSDECYQSMRKLRRFVANERKRKERARVAQAALRRAERGQGRAESQESQEGTVRTAHRLVGEGV